MEKFQLCVFGYDVQRYTLPLYICADEPKIAPAEGTLGKSRELKPSAELFVCVVCKLGLHLIENIVRWFGWRYRR